jgi:hypothetical protein
MSNEQKTSEQNQQSKQNHDKKLTKQEIFLHRPELLYEMDENKFIEFQRSALNEKKQKTRPTTEQELAREKEQQRRRNVIILIL